jgi:hypothetical protein
MLQWLKVQTWCTFDTFTCTGAAQRGQLAALKHLRSEGCEWIAGIIVCEAARAGSIEQMQWLRQQQEIEITALTLAYAADRGQTTICEHLRSIGCDWDASACCYAAANGHFETLRWLRASGCPWTVSAVCAGAAQLGSTDILDYVIEQGELLSILSC